MKKDMNRIEDLFVLYERIFAIAGVWPSENSSYVRFMIYFTYYITFLVFSYADLFDIIGNLELMVMNMVETIVYTITFTMILVIRFNGSLKSIVENAKENIWKYNFENEEEKIIYNNYHYVSKMFFKVSNIGMIITVTLSYIRPLINFATVTAKDNSTNIYILPIRIHTFFELSNTRDYVLVYIYLFPMIYMSTCHMTAICVLVNLVLLICTDLSILSHRIRNIDVKSNKDVVNRRIRSLVKMHLKIIWMAESLDNAFNIVLLDELLGNSIVLAISIYYVLMSYDTAEMVTCCTFVFFAFTALLMLYGFCVIGDQLTQQSENVLNAYYECNWQDMSNSTKRSLLICMIRSQKYFNLTGGKFYVFSLNGFTDILKTSMAYLSMLRTIIKKKKKKKKLKEE
ncbi:odorant receptor 2a-like [Vespa velutina]|uniref:odorant receptor 2a-like n=1 Tax=Vespa velutina TaxID=202808 RepID=UPI001FB1ACAD|nr:odorant receptor 2a-like [Vespa velutina]